MFDQRVLANLFLRSIEATWGTSTLNGARSLVAVGKVSGLGVTRLRSQPNSANPAAAMPAPAAAFTKSRREGCAVDRVAELSLSMSHSTPLSSFTFGEPRSPPPSPPSHHP